MSSLIICAHLAPDARADLKDADMTIYRAYAVRFDGNFSGYEALICADDNDATVKARGLTQNSAIELWTGERFVTRLEHRPN